MEFWTAVAVLRRRWYVFIPGLVLTMVLALLLGGQAKPTYKASGSVKLQVPGRDPAASGGTPTTTLAGQGGSNPIGDIDRFQALNLLAQVADDSVFRDRVIANGGSGAYTVAPPFANTPSLSFSTIAATPERAMADYKVLIETFKQEVTSEQDGSPRASYLEAVENTSPANAFPQNGARTKGIIVIGLIGFLLSIGASFLVDSMMAARHRAPAPRRRPGALVSLTNLRSPLDELAELDATDDPEARGSFRRGAEVPASDIPGRRAGGLGGNPTQMVMTRS